MTTKFILFLFFILSGVSLLAQDTPPTTVYNKQFGFDASIIVNRFFNFSGGTPPSSPYQITYRTYGATSNKRYGLGFQIGIEGGDPDLSSLSSISYRFGKERFKQFGKALPTNSAIKRWRAFYGWDWKTDLTVQHTGAIDLTNFIVSIGPSPLFGVSFQINERLSISTEMAYDFILSYSRINEGNLVRFSGNFVPPVALYLGYDF